jgi:hypothetical protein
MVVQFSRVVIQRTGPYDGVLGKQTESPKVSQVHHHIQNNIITSSYQKYSHHVHLLKLSNRIILIIVTNSQRITKDRKNRILVNP